MLCKVRTWSPRLPGTGQRRTIPRRGCCRDIATLSTIFFIFSPLQVPAWAVRRSVRWGPLSGTTLSEKIVVSGSFLQWREPKRRVAVQTNRCRECRVVPPPPRSRSLALLGTPYSQEPASRQQSARAPRRWTGGWMVTFRSTPLGSLSLSVITTTTITARDGTQPYCGTVSVGTPKKKKKIEVVQCSAVAVPPCAVHSHPHPQTRSPFPFPAPDPNHPHSFLPLSFPKLLRTYRSTSYSPPMCKILVISIQPHNHTYTHTDNILRPQHVHATYAWLFSSPRVINHSIGRYDAYLRTLP